MRLCLLTVAGAAFYYPAAFLIGLVTAIHLLLLPSAWQGDSRSWTWRRRIVVLSVTAATAGVLLIPALIAGRSYGPLLGHEDLAAYPEAGRDGRYADADLPLRGQFVEMVKNHVGISLISGGRPWNENLYKRGRRSALKGSLRFWLGFLFIAGYGSLLLAENGARRLLALMIAPCVLYPLALALWPRLYLPYRYVTYAVPVLVPIVLPAAIASLAQRLRPLRASPLARAAVVIGAMVLLLLFLGGRGSGHAGIGVTIAEADRPLYGFLARLPPDAMIAGWPGEAIENVPYLSGRRILLSFEVHQAFHKAYADEMRRRMDALIDAYFATDVTPLLRLHRELGVTHLLVNRDHYDRERPSYFMPFRGKIAAVVRASRGQPETLRQSAAAAVFEDGPLVVLDLNRIAATQPSAAKETKSAS
jgi:hypothetical protein